MMTPSIDHRVAHRSQERLAHLNDYRGARCAAEHRKGGEPMSFDEIFADEAVMDVPSAASEYNRKAPGHQDSNGDHCVD
ncbi:hypothetical protein BJF90_18015 [Pseudonocardia sp. CNS-004]|jgi:hypothetical protein|nr:hypothetical protein BJF90_18015 [Pseudonocardia sp. CNS-004]